MLTKDEIQEQLLSALSALLGGENELSATDNLLKLGLESLPTMRLLAGWIKQGYRVSFGSFMRRPTVEDWAQMLSGAAPAAPAADGNRSGKADGKALPGGDGLTGATRDGHPFDLTDVQYAYWVGRGREHYLGGVGCHGYVEVETGPLDLVRLEDSWGAILRAHPMLRACYTSDGQQYVLPEPRAAAVTVHDLTGLGESERQDAVSRLREATSHRLLDIGSGQVCCLQVSLLGPDRALLHFDIDLLVCDVQSFQIILRDLAHHYLTGEPPRVDPGWSFATYLEVKAREERVEAERDQEYWRSRLNGLTSGPQLPLRQGAEKVKDPRFVRRAHTFGQETWQALRAACEEHGTTPAMVLLTAYARTIGQWSDNKRFLMSIPLFNRDSDPAIENVVADFTTLTLTEIDQTHRRSFAEDLRAIQDAFYEDVSHSKYSAVRVLRDLRTQRGEQVLAPVVFSCNLGNPLVDEEFIEAFGEIGYMISQTPQVWVDLQVFNTIDGFIIIWDAVEQIFPEGLLDEMFDCLVREIERAVASSLEHDGPVESRGVTRRRRERAAVSGWQLPAATLIDGVLAAAREFPDSPALSTCDGRTMTYQEVAGQAQAVARSLVLAGASKGQLAAVMLPRGPEQIVAALGVMIAGMAYVPISPQQPQDRVLAILSSPRIRFLLTSGHSPRHWPDAGVTVMAFEEARSTEQDAELPGVCAGDSAYVIYTSGTTGTPKGVEISHGAAWNTIAAVNQRIGLGPQDVVLGVSSFDFDLSVYDAFGVLAAGGELVTIAEEARRDATVWLGAVESRGITVWNSVPTLFEMLLACAGEDPRPLASLRHVLLSGDWIDVSLPARLRNLVPGCRLLAMGGATEASIWSNALDVGDVPEDWVSIPYGRALEGQAYRVVDAAGRDCPDYVAGELWIGGLGVAERYVDDPRLTGEKFVADEGSRWYRTGDLGRFWHDDTIEFLGRSDNQVKVRGHRIELGEIEAACEALPAVKRAVCIAWQNQASKSLVAFVQLDQEAAADDGEAGAPRVDAAGLLAPRLADEETRAAIARDESVQRGYALEVMRRWTRQLAGRSEAAATGGALSVLVQNWGRWLRRQGEDQTLPPTKAERSELDHFVGPFGRAFVECDRPVPVAEFVQSPDFVPVEEFLANRPLGRLAHAAIGDLLGELGRVLGHEPRVLELGARRPRESGEYRRLSGASAYIVADYSHYYLDRLEESAPECFERMLLNPATEAAAAPGNAHPDERVDLVICNQTLHQAADIDATLGEIHRLLSPQGLLIFVEPTATSPLADVSAAFLRAAYRDARQDTGEMLLTAQAWRQALERSGYTLVSRADLTSSLMLCVAARTSGDEARQLQGPDYDEAIKTLSERLPEYMLPKRIVQVAGFPLTANGKVDRKALAGLVPPETPEEDPNPRAGALTRTEQRLIGIWNALLGAEANVDSDYFRLGGDSLIATRLRREIEECFEVDFGLDAVFDSPVLADMAARIDGLVAEARRKDDLPPMVHGEDQYEPFPLTEVQQSYLIGRSGAVELGDVSSHCYFEMATPPLDPARLEESFNAVIVRHPMLRAVVCDDALSQRFLPEVPRYEIAHISGEGPGGDELLAEVRQSMSHQRFDPRHWPCFDVRYASLADGTGRLFLSFDNIFVDGWGMFHVFREWKERYDSGAQRSRAAEPPYSFKDYVEAVTRLRNSETYRRDLEYWEESLERIHPAPQLPVSPLDGAESSEFVRYRAVVETPVWQAAKERIRQEGLTEAAFLAEVYAEVLARYSESPGFSINLTQFDRIRFAPEVDSIVGDFTSLSILSVDAHCGSSFRERARTLQQRMWRNLAHSHVSGVTVERMLNRQRKSQITMPVVFTCGLGVIEHAEAGSPYLGVIDYGLSQTPQVWMDLQVYEDRGGLVLNLDAIEAIFPDRMVAEMFSSLTQAVETLATTSSSWAEETVTVCPEFNTGGIAELNDTDSRDERAPGGWNKDTTLLDLFAESRRTHGERIAVIDPARALSYADLDEESGRWARLIAAAAPEPGSLVAILMPKSAHQISAVLGVLKAGCAYLPLSASHPPARNGRILADAGARIVITDSADQASGEIGQGRAVITVADLHGADSGAGVGSERHEAGTPLEDARPPATEPGPSPEPGACGGPEADGLAYIIYTSGTTGTPKGVAITHRAAVNTVLDVNSRLAVGPSDRVLALSQLNFDLSVYDIFGMFAAGGAIVLPSPEGQRDPAHWWELARAHQVTVWNSVPSLFTMYVSHLADRGLVDETIRATLLSGDWIPVDVALRIAQTFRDCQAYGLGGATEASIWSNWYEIHPGDANRGSIPYGKPLTNQRMYVLDAALEHRPDLVPGDLYIAGRGLALGYWNDPDKTEKSFIQHPRTGERLYRTGDQAMYGRDGNIIFLGRRDGQVKVNGYRIELGEIESVARAVPGVRDCVATTARGISLYLVTDDDLAGSRVSEHLAASLPEYMRPRRVVTLAELPRTWNGKIDRDSLDADVQEVRPAAAGPRSGRDERLIAMWSALLELEDIGIDDDFFRLGGDSLAAVHLANSIRREMSVEVSIREIFSCPTVRQLSDHIEASVGADVDEGEI